MSSVFQILVSSRGLRVALALGGVAALVACGQKGALYLPTGEAAAGRATLPQTLNPAGPASAPAATPAPRP